LKLDGVVMLLLIDSNAGYVHMADILQRLWNSAYNIKNETEGDIANTEALIKKS
jgi:hypothetical protein